MREHRPDVGIRQWSEGDFHLLERLLGDPAMTVHLGGPETPDKLRARHQRYLSLDDSADGVFAIVLGPEKTAVGWVGYWETTWQDQHVWETGWHVLSEVQGQGVATAATALAIERARAEGTYRFMHAFPSVANAASNAICRRLGFALRGEVDIEYPPGNPMRSNDWQLDLECAMKAGIRKAYDEETGEKDGLLEL